MKGSNDLKKVISAIVAMSLVFVLSACGDKKTQSTVDSKTNVLGNDTLVGVSDLAQVTNEKKLGFQFEKPEKGEEIAVVTMENGKSFKIRFFPDEAPKAVYNFKKHAVDGYYNGITFHRVMSTFMIQGGDPTATGMGGESVWGQAFEDEFSKNVANFNGSLSMANSGKNTNGSQFFINNSQTGYTTWDVMSQNYEFAISDPDTFELYTGRRGYLDVPNLTDEYKKMYEEKGGAPFLDGAYSTDSVGHTVFGQVFEGMDVVTEISNTEVVENQFGDLSAPKEPVVIKSIEIVIYE